MRSGLKPHCLMVGKGKITSFNPCFMVKSPCFTSFNPVKSSCFLKFHGRSRPKSIVFGVSFHVFHGKINTGWWFGAFSIFPYIRNNHPN